MKNVVLATLLLLGVSDAFGVSVERNGVSIKYVKIGSRFIRALGEPYRITIANHSAVPIIVDASLIKNPLHSLNAIAQAMLLDYKITTMLLPLAVLSLGSVTYLVRESEYPFLGGAVVTGSLTAHLLYHLYKLATETEGTLEAKLAKEVLHSPITIQPGQSVEKLFWLKNPNDPVEIEFDTVKVLK